MRHDPTAALPPLAGYHPTTLLDWPGRIAAILFLPRCNLRCRFCHAGSLLVPARETIPLEPVLDHLRAQAGWIDGVVVCGGEPTLWPGLGRLCETLRREGLAVRLDTNGTHPDHLQDLLEARLVDAVAMDLKAPLDHRHRATCGPEADLRALDRSIDLVMASGLEYEFRTTVVPELLGPAEIEAIGQRIAGARRWVLQRFDPTHALDPLLRSVEPYDLGTMEALADLGRRFVERCHVRGMPERVRPEPAGAR